MTFVRIAKITDVKPGQGKVVSANGEEIALFNVNGKFFAINNTCPHRQGPLGEGELEGQIVTCPWHGWRFDVTTGVSPVNPAAKVKRYEIKIEGEDILIDV